jgi:hypothetical protein
VLHLLLFVGLGALAILSNLVIWFYPEAMADDPLQDFLDKDPWFAAYHKVSAIVGYTVLVAVGISAVGLLKGKEWARKTTICWALFNMAWSSYDAWVTHKYVTGAMMAQVMADTSEAPMVASTTALMQTTMAFSTMLAAVATLAYGTLVIFMLRRPKVVAWCRRTTEEKQTAV